MKEFYLEVVGTGVSHSLTVLSKGVKSYYCGYLLLRPPTIERFI